MPDRIPDLWGGDLHLHTLTPKMILNAQSTSLSQRMKGLIVAELIARQSEDMLTLLFDLRAPAVSNFRHRVLKVKYPASTPYPCLIAGRPLFDLKNRSFKPVLPDPQEESYSTNAFTEREFIDLVQLIFQHPTTRSIIDSLIAQSNEAKNPPPIRVENASFDDASKLEPPSR